MLHRSQHVLEIADLEIASGYPRIDHQGKIRLDQQFPVSEEAASRSPSKLALTPGDAVAVRELILGIVTKSANDAAAVLAEGLAGSEPRFAE